MSENTKKKGLAENGKGEPLNECATGFPVISDTSGEFDLGGSEKNIKPKPNTSASIQWLQGWSEQGPWNLTAIPPEGGRTKNATFDRGQVQAMRDFIDEYQGRWNLYFTVNPLMHHMSKKPTKGDIRGMSAIHVDVDPYVGEDLQVERERILTMLQTGLPKGVPEPTAIIDSGGGYQAFWLLEEEAKTGGSVERAEELEAFNLQIELLLKADSCHNIDRIMRLPGTINVPSDKKRARGRVEALASVVDVDWSRVYDLGQFTPAPKLEAGKAQTNVTGPIQVAAKLSDETLRELGLSDDCLAKIVTGTDPMDGSKTDRSSLVFNVLCDMIRADVPNEVMKAVILDPDFKISAHVLEQPKPERYADRQIERALEEQPRPGPIVEFSPMGMARAFLEHRAPHLLHVQEEFLTWDGSAYQVLTGDDIEADLWLFLETCRIQAPPPKGSNSGEPIIKQLVVKNAIASDVKKALKACVHNKRLKLTEEGWLNPEGKPDQRNLVAVGNGILDLSTKTLLPASPDFFVRSALPFDYDASAPEPTRWLQFLDEVWPDADQVDCKTALQEAMGYSLTTDTSLQKAFYLYGKTRSGKGTILTVLSNLVGPENVTSPGVGDFSGSFCFQPFLGKKIAMLSDARLGWGKDSGPITENFLKIIGEDSVSINRKGKDFLNAKLNCKIWVGSNEILKVQDASGALAARFIFLPMRESFLGKEDPNLGERLAAELPGILNWAIEGWARVKQTRKITVPASAAEEVQHMRSMAEPVHEFYSEHCEHVDGAWEAKEVVFDRFRAWYLLDRNSEYKGGSGQFFRKLKEVMPDKSYCVSKMAVGYEGERKNVLKGFRCLFVPTFEASPI